MEKHNTRVERVFQDLFYDCIFVTIDGISTQIVFNKSSNVFQYNGKDIILSKCNGEDYAIEEISAESNQETQVDNSDSEIEIPFIDIVDESAQDDETQDLESEE